MTQKSQGSDLHPSDFRAASLIAAHNTGNLGSHAFLGNLELSIGIFRMKTDVQSRSVMHGAGASVLSSGNAGTDSAPAGPPIYRAGWWRFGLWVKQGNHCFFFLFRKCGIIKASHENHKTDPERQKMSPGKGAEMSG